MTHYFCTAARFQHVTRGSHTLGVVLRRRERPHFATGRHTWQPVGPRRVCQSGRPVVPSRRVIAGDARGNSRQPHDSFIFWSERETEITHVLTITTS